MTMSFGGSPHATSSTTAMLRKSSICLARRSLLPWPYWSQLCRLHLTQLCLGWVPSGTNSAKPKRSRETEKMCVNV